MGHHGRRHQQEPGGDGRQKGGQLADFTAVYFFPEEKKKDDGQGCQDRVDDPGRLKNKARDEEERIAGRVDAVPLPVVDDMGEVEEFPATGRGSIEPPRLKEPGLEKIGDLVVDMRNSLEDKRRKKTAENEDKRSGKHNRKRDPRLFPRGARVHPALFNRISPPLASFIRPGIEVARDGIMV